MAYTLRAMEEPRVSVRAVARATGKPLRTVQRWFHDAPRHARAPGYPASVVVAVLARHGIAVAADDAATWREPDAEMAHADAPQTAVMARLDALARQMDAMARAIETPPENVDVALRGAKLAEVVSQAVRETLEAPEGILARRAEELAAENGRLRERVAWLEGQLALPAPRRPWWKVLFRRR